jgi:CubicO group peptidase (beta-lactamase class C family)
MLLLLALGPVPAAPALAQPSPASAAPDLTGLWTAVRRFGPDARGPLLIQRTGEGYSAEMVGRVVPVRVEQGGLVFDLPGGEGTFRGRFEGRNSIAGHWLQPGTAVNNGRYASPVLLRADGPGRWRGEVDAWENRFGFHLLVQARPDGSLGAVLRNPERDVGSQMGANRLVRDGSVLRLMGQRAGQAERELASGVYHPDADIVSLRFPSRGGTYDFSRAGDESGFYPRGRIPAAYRYRRPPALDDGWSTGTLEEADIDRAGIERFVQSLVQLPMDSADAPQIHAILIARRGRLVVEEYFHGFHRDMLHDTRSAAKSVAATVAGAAIHAGAPLSLASPVYSVMNGGAFPEGLDPRMRTMTLEHLLTMSSGYFCDDTDATAPGNEETMTNQSEEPDYYRYTLRVPLATPPGERSVYCSASPNLALGMVGRATGESQLSTFDRLIGRPMAISRYAWPLDGAGQPYGGGSVQLLPRDFIKFGQLMLDGGVWRGRRILGREFAARAVAPQYNLRNIQYGYNWWVEDYPYKDRTVRSFSARGAGGQLVTVVPELELVVATMAGNYFSRIQGSYTGAIVPTHILPAVRERGDDRTAPVVPRPFTSPYGRSENGSRVTRTQ